MAAPTLPEGSTRRLLTSITAGGIAIVLSSRVTTAPFRSLWTTLGAIALGATVLMLLDLQGRLHA